MDIIQSAVLAAIQGISAWIPVSSKTQVILAANAFYGVSLELALTYALVLHVGDFIAALFNYRTEYIETAKLLLNPSNITKFESNKQEYCFLFTSIFATAIIALPAYLLLKKYFINLSGEPLLFLIGILLILMALMVIYSKRQVRESQITLKTALVTGAAQGLAIIPGISRSGITQSALLLQGIEPSKAMRLSFLMSAPMIAAAFVAFYFVQGFHGLTLMSIAVGIAISAIVSLLTMNALTKIAQKIPSHYFLIAIGILATLPLILRLLFSIAY